MKDRIFADVAAFAPQLPTMARGRGKYDISKSLRLTEIFARLGEPGAIRVLIELAKVNPIDSAGSLHGHLYGVPTVEAADMAARHFAEVYLPSLAAEHWLPTQEAREVFPGPVVTFPSFANDPGLRSGVVAASAIARLSLRIDGKLHMNTLRALLAGVQSPSDFVSEASFNKLTQELTKEDLDSPEVLEIVLKAKQEAAKIGQNPYRTYSENFWTLAEQYWKARGYGHVKQQLKEIWGDNNRQAPANFLSGWKADEILLEITMIQTGVRLEAKEPMQEIRAAVQAAHGRPDPNYQLDGLFNNNANTPEVAANWMEEAILGTTFKAASLAEKQQIVATLQASWLAAKEAEGKLAKIQDLRHKPVTDASKPDPDQQSKLRAAASGFSNMVENEWSIKPPGHILPPPL